MQMGAVAKSYLRGRGFLIYEEMRKYFVIYEKAVRHLIYEENLIFFFISV